MNVNRMTGTVWHTEQFHRSEDDPRRRYKGRCKFFSYEEEYCSRYCTRCRGSAHCDEYEAISEQEFKSRQRALQKKKQNRGSSGDEEVYWY